MHAPAQVSDAEAERIERSLSGPQRQALERVLNAPGGDPDGQDFYVGTVRALKRKGLVEDAPRMYFGPRTWRVRLTNLGLLVVRKSKPAICRFQVS